MKKVLLIILTTILLVGCGNEETKQMKIYDDYIEYLESVEKSSEDIPFKVEITVNKITDGILSYKALIDKENLNMNDIEAILVHDKKSENAFPSIGIFEDKISLDDKSTEKGVKLSGYIEEHESIEFKLLIKYKDENKKEKKYVYVYNYRQD